MSCKTIAMLKGSKLASCKQFLDPHLPYRKGGTPDQTFFRKLFARTIRQSKYFDQKKVSTGMRGGSQNP